MKRIFCILSLALNIAFATHSVAILPSEGTLSDDELELLTDKMREAALNVLPVSEFTLLKQDVVIKRLGGMESYIKECSETSCIVNLGKKAQVDYVAQCRVGKLGDNLRITVELYDVSTGGLLGMFSNVVDDFSKLPPMMSYRIPAVFRNITAQKQGATEPVKNITAQKQEVTEPVVTADVWNWVYGEFFPGNNYGGSTLNVKNKLLGFGMRYERKLISRISVGGRFYLCIPVELEVQEGKTSEAFDEIKGEIDAGYFYGIDAFFYFYPWRWIFLGVGVGYHHSNNYIYSDSMDYYNSFRGGAFYTAYRNGIKITPEIGLKLDFGEDGGFCINLGFAMSLIIGKDIPDAAYFYDANYSLTKTKGASDDEALSKSSFESGLFSLSVGYGF
jgi:TolB-like protein